MWLVWHDCLLHRRLLATRGIVSDDDLCPRCHETREDSAYILVFCPKSRDVWDLDEVPFIPCHDLRLWLKKNMTSQSMFSRVLWSTVFPYLCHEVLKDRNMCVFKAKDPSLINVISFRALGGERVFMTAYSAKELGTLANLRFDHPSSCLLIYVDASFVGPRKIVGIGGVVRDSRKKWLFWVRETCLH